MKYGNGSYHKLKEQSRFSNKMVCNPNDKLEAQCFQGLTHVSQDIDGKWCFKIPTLISGSIIMDKGDTLQQSHGRSIIIKNSTSTESTKSTCIVQHKVLMLGDGHLRGSVVKLRSE
jgi:hypothetical protein